jgi:hypothetical protein
MLSQVPASDCLDN